jgi:hypothetical protein
LLELAPSPHNVGRSGERQALDDFPLSGDRACLPTVPAYKSLLIDSEETASGHGVHLDRAVVAAAANRVRGAIAISERFASGCYFAPL